MRSLFLYFIIIIHFLTVSCHEKVNEVWLDEMNYKHFKSGYKATKANNSIEGNSICIAGIEYERGIGTHAPAVGVIQLDGKADVFEAMVGVNDETLNRGETEFFVVTQGRILWRSGCMKGGDPAQKIKLDVSGLNYLGLLTSSYTDEINFDHADWAEARIQYHGKKPEMIPNWVENSTVLTPKASLSPSINGAKVLGVRPGNLIDFSVAVSGERPLRFLANGLPKPLELDERTGRITGRIIKPGEYSINIEVSNCHGRAQKNLRIVVGKDICLTPIMGWNSWYCWSESVSQKKIEQTARAMVDKGLVDYGWSYVNIDDCWQGRRGGKYNAIQGNERFPDIKSMCDSIHKWGLKVGIYSTPWMGSYGGFIGASAPNTEGDYSSMALSTKERLQPSQLFGRYPGTHKMGSDTIGPVWMADADHRQWAEWGIDMVKYDWNPNDVATTQKLAYSLERCGRDIVLSLSNSAPFKDVRQLSNLAQMWRTTGDIHDSWQSISAIGFSQDKWACYARPGHWNDPDMLQVGNKGIPNKFNRQLMATNLTPNEQYTQMSLWSLLSAPLLLSCDIETMDDFTLALLTNPEVIAIDQDPLGKPAKIVYDKDGVKILLKELVSGQKALGVFYTSNTYRLKHPLDYFFWGKERIKKVTVPVSILTGVKSGVIRDLWRRCDMAQFSKEITVDVTWHGVRLLLVKNYVNNKITGK